MLLIFSPCLAVSSASFIQYNNPNLNNCFQLINNSPMEKELFKLIWLNWVTSHSSASNIKKFQSKQVDIIVTDYHTWPAKLFWVCNNIGRQAPFFFNTTSSLMWCFLSSINDSGGNNEKIYKTGWEFSWYRIFHIIVNI